MRTRILTALVLGWLPLGGASGAPVWLKPGDDPLAKEAEARLMGGYPLLASQLARKCLAATPDNLACVAVHGRAAATLGNCEAALPALARVRQSEHWTPAAALSEGVCHVRNHDFDSALVAFEESAWLKERNPTPYLQLGLAHARLGDLDGLADDLEKSYEYDADPWVLDLLELWGAYVGLPGEPEVDAALWHLDMRRGDAIHPNLRIHTALVDCERWMEVGDPVAALASASRGVAASRNHTRLLACRAEAARRSGDAILAVEITSRQWNSFKTTPLLDAVLVRALVDRGQFAEAHEALDPSMLDKVPELVTSAWYLARAEGDTASMARFERARSMFGREALEALDRLDPIVGER